MVSKLNLPKTCKNRPLIIRVDANLTIGTGHLMRQWALAQSWRDQVGTPVIFAVNECLDDISLRIKEDGFTFHWLSSEVNALTDLVSKTRAIAVVIDGYQFGEEFLRSLHNSLGVLLVVFDDYQYADGFYCDVLVNTQVGASRTSYDKLLKSESRFLFGTKYTMFRDEFIKSSLKQRLVNEDRPIEIVVTLGGAGSEDSYQEILNELDKVHSYHFNITVASRIKMPLTSKRHSVCFWNYNEPISKLFSIANLAISAGGTTCYELLYFQIPFITIITADNQTKVTDELEKLKLTYKFAALDDISSALSRVVEAYIKDLDSLGKKLQEWQQRELDGRGRDRIVKEILQHSLGKIISLRNATLEDAQILRAWRNDPETVRFSIRQAMVEEEEHLQWLKLALTSTNRVLYIAEIDSEPVGTLRIDRLQENEKLELSWTVNPSRRGLGIGTEIVRCGIKKFGPLLQALIKNENIASRKIVESLDFQRVSEENGVTRWEYS